MLNSCLDIFEARLPSKTFGQDFGLLHALDERIAMYGWLLNTGVKLVIVVDMEGRQARSVEEAKLGMLGLRGGDLTAVSFFEFSFSIQLMWRRIVYVCMYMYVRMYVCWLMMMMARLSKLLTRHILLC